MFESNIDVDFGDEFTLDLNKINETSNKKRPSESPPTEAPKKQKIIPLPLNPVKRKFPGPAGILPDRKNLNSNPLESPGAKTYEIPCSQMTLSVFQGSPWINMCQDYDSLIDLYDIKWIKTSARLNKLENQKAPFLAAIIKNIERYEGKSRIVKVSLKDASGEIQGTILNSLYEEYSESLVPGTVIVLRQCGVTSYGNNHYLSIIPNNLVTIYWKNNDEIVVICVQKLPCDDLMGKTNNFRRKSVCTDGEEKDDGRSQSDVTNDDMWKNALEGVDIDSFFEDF